MYSENFSAWTKESDLPPMTRTQREFAEFMLENWKVFSVLGNIDNVFLNVKKFIKYSDNFKKPKDEKTGEKEEIL